MVCAIPVSDERRERPLVEGTVFEAYAICSQWRAELRGRQGGDEARVNAAGKEAAKRNVAAQPKGNGVREETQAFLFGVLSGNSQLRLELQRPVTAPVETPGAIDSQHLAREDRANAAVNRFFARDGTERQIIMHRLEVNREIDPGDAQQRLDLRSEDDTAVD